MHLILCFRYSSLVIFLPIITYDFLYLTTFLDDEYIIKALHIGAKGYILKQNFESIVPSLKAVAIGQNVFGDEIITKLPLLLQNNPQEHL